MGDYVVHVDHGVGRFGGLVRTVENGKQFESIKLEYRDGDVLLVNVHSLHRIARYKSGDGEPPKIHKLGSGAWQKLKNATKKSFIIYDEIGRGTSTYDGLSIAWAVLEHLSKSLNCKTLFATHYHELIDLEGKIEGIIFCSGCIGDADLPTNKELKRFLAENGNREI